MSTATQIGAALASGATSAVEVTETALQEAATQAHLNAFITMLPDRALTAARASDVRRRAGQQRGALDGVPFAVKDNIAVAGVATTDGTRAFRDRIAAADATVITRLEQAGAILIGTLNMHEGALGATTDNPFWGRCDNPAAPGHTPGGSSGGSAAAIAAGIVPLTLGTDTMGSVRIPAAYCGLWGLKPTRGLIPVTGLSHLSWTLDSIGPIAATADDLAMALAVLAGFDGADNTSEPLPPGWEADGRASDLAGVTLGLPDYTSLTSCDLRVTQAFARLVDRARDAGAVIRPLSIAHWTPDILRRAGLLVTEAECGHLIGATLDAEPEGFSDGFRGAINYGRHAQGARIAAAYRIIAQAGSGARRALEGIDAILLPTAPQPAFPHGTPAPVNQADFTAPANAAGLPAIAFPLPSSDLPLSVQLIGPAFSEGRLISLARALTSEVS